MITIKKLVIRVYCNGLFMLFAWAYNAGAIAGGVIMDRRGESIAKKWMTEGTFKAKLK